MTSNDVLEALARINAGEPHNGDLDVVCLAALRHAESCLKERPKVIYRTNAGPRQVLAGVLDRAVGERDPEGRPLVWEEKGETLVRVRELLRHASALVEPGNDDWLKLPGERDVAGILGRNPDVLAERVRTRHGRALRVALPLGELVEMVRS